MDDGVRRLTADEIAAVGAELGAVPVRWVSAPADPADPAGAEGLGGPGGRADPTAPGGPRGRVEPGDPTEPAATAGAAHLGDARADPATTAGPDPTGIAGADPGEAADADGVGDAGADPTTTAGPDPTGTTGPTNRGDADAEGLADAGDMADPVAAVAAAQQADSLAGVIASLLVAIVWARPFDRLNAAVGVASADLLARLNGHVLVMEPADATVELIGRVRAGAVGADAVREWLTGRLLPDIEPEAPPVTEPIVARPPAAVRRPRSGHAWCPWCAMPLRESLTAVVLPAGGGTTVAACGGCGLLLPRPHQEV